MLAATVQAAAKPAATPTTSGQSAPATVVTAATEVARLRALPPDPTPVTTPVIPLQVTATSQSPAYRIVACPRNAVNPNRVKYGVDPVVPDEYSRDQVLATVSAATHRVFDTMPDAKAVHTRVILQSGYSAGFDGVVALADTSTDGLDLSGTKPQDSNMHVSCSGHGAEPGDSELTVDF